MGPSCAWVRARAGCSFADLSCNNAKVDWNDLRYFLAITETGTLGGAAKLLRVDASTVSRRLAALEKSVGARLFERDGAGYRPTAAASSVMTEARGVEQQVHAF